MRDLLGTGDEHVHVHVCMCEVTYNPKPVHTQRVQQNKVMYLLAFSTHLCPRMAQNLDDLRKLLFGMLFLHKFQLLI